MIFITKGTFDHVLKNYGYIIIVLSKRNLFPPWYRWKTCSLGLKTKSFICYDWWVFTRRMGFSLSHPNGHVRYFHHFGSLVVVGVFCKPFISSPNSPDQFKNQTWCGWSLDGSLQCSRVLFRRESHNIMHQVAKNCVFCCFFCFVFCLWSVYFTTNSYCYQDIKGM